MDDSATDISYRSLSTAADLKACEALERLVWGIPDLEVLPVAQFVASVHAGGVVLGAYAGADLVGFVYGFPAHRPGWPRPWGLHSHMLAVAPGARGRGIGQALKWRQRDWCLDRGLPWMTWTFDPLQARNAKLNLEHLAAEVVDYREDEYGPMGGDLNAGLPSDRLLAFWDLGSAAVAGRARGEPRERPDPSNAPLRLEADEAGRPKRNEAPLDEFVRVAVPPSLTELLKTSPEQALSWRLAARETLAPLLSGGWRARRFLGGAYFLKRQ